MKNRTTLALLLLTPALCSVRQINGSVDAAEAEAADVAAGRIHRYMLTLNAPESAAHFLITVEPRSDMPFRGTALAHTTIQRTVEPPTSTCILHFTAETVRSESVLAHEACHCAIDRSYIGEHGYRSFVSPELRTRLEHRAQACERWLTAPEPRPRRNGPPGPPSFGVTVDDQIEMKGWGK